jgi:hypothetical protein
MTSEQIEVFRNLIRGYDFAYKATKQDNYRITRDKLLKQLEAILSPIKYELKLAA